MIKEAFKSLEPGGYLELQDECFPFQYRAEPPKDSALYTWTELVLGPSVDECATLQTLDGRIRL